MFEDLAIRAADLLLFVFFSTLILIVAWGALWVRTVKKSSPPLYYVSKGKEKKVENVEPYTIFKAVIDCVVEEQKDKKKDKKHA